MRIKVDGETITDAEPVIGYLHRGWEKMTEDRRYPQIIPMSDRLCYGSSFTWSHVYCMAVEDLMGIEVPEKAKYIRAMFVDEGTTKEKLKIPLSMCLAIGICIVATIVIGVWPDPVINVCEQAARTLFPAI